MLDDEAVEGEVLVKRANDVVTVGVGVGVAALLLEDVTFGVGVARHVEPVTAPALAIARRAEQPIHHPGERFGRLVGKKICDLTRRGGQAGQIVGRATNQGPFVRLPGGRQPPGLEFCQHECVDRIVPPPGIANGR